LSVIFLAVQRSTASPSAHRLLVTWLTTAVVDGIFASVLSVVYNSDATRVWKGVAAVLLGPTAMKGGTSTVLIGLVMHLTVALTWSLVFLFLYESSQRLRELARSRFGVLKVASVYGPFIWLVMSLVVIPLLTHRSPTLSGRWLFQLVAHIPFVAMPIVWGISRYSQPAAAQTQTA